MHSFTRTLRIATILVGAGIIQQNVLAADAPTPAPNAIQNATVRDMRILGLWENAPGEFGGSGWTVESYRPPDKNLVVIVGHCTDCGD